MWRRAVIVASALGCAACGPAPQEAPVGAPLPGMPESIGAADPTIGDWQAASAEARRNHMRTHAGVVLRNAQPGDLDRAADDLVRCVEGHAATAPAATTISSLAFQCESAIGASGF